MSSPFLLFDFDGTIADSIHLGMRIANNLAPQFGIKPLSEEQFAHLRTMSIPKALKIIDLPFYKVPKAITLALVEYRKLIHELMPFAGIPEMLKELKELGCHMALLTSNTGENVKHFLDLHELHYFDWIEGTSGILKKHSSIRKQIKKHKLDKANVIYVGDEIRDITAARKSGIRVISVSWGFHTTDLLSRFDPDYLVEKPSEIVGLIKSVSKPRQK
jgi:phosphoglycolate phosphatase|nr:HAD-IA family hydrolase [Candidatus Cloacimonadota bacterium]MDY0126972.1 HAD-IA family hydrolase [Candidatus Cloacimonadaceae bacterium]MCB5255763.1 HAD-IA family hydrolase [Candidatus Cloacimonadota bacterium]MCK9178607.1 HAD-IA family hydrolase [Candidatus Cloacimonadota bacterium]MCK9242789.1 HAD-IA family hydrolase [Candidatus Cloacimonadota bacterium]